MASDAWTPSFRVTKAQTACPLISCAFADDGRLGHLLVVDEGAPDLHRADAVAGNGSDIGTGHPDLMDSEPSAIAVQVGARVVEPPP